MRHGLERGEMPVARIVPEPVASLRPRGQTHATGLHQSWLAPQHPTRLTPRRIGDEEQVGLLGIRLRELPLGVGVQHERAIAGLELDGFGHGERSAANHHPSVGAHAREEAAGVGGLRRFTEVHEHEDARAHLEGRDLRTDAAPRLEPTLWAPKNVLSAEGHTASLKESRHFVEPAAAVGYPARVTPDDEALIEEARRVYGRYAKEFVEELRMCPWAARSRAEHHTEERYLLGQEPDEEQALAAIDAFAKNPGIEVGLVIFPQLALDRPEFERWVARLRELDTARCRPARPEMALAAFHPDAEANTETPYRLVPFIRRSPDPLVQCVRTSILDDLRKEDRGTNYVDPKGADLLALFKTLQEKRPPLHERVAEMNRDTLLGLGIERARALLDDILRDRDRSYARFGVPARAPKLGGPAT